MAIRINTSITTIPLIDENGNLICELKINTADVNFTERVFRLQNAIETVSARTEKAANEYAEKYKDIEDMTLDMEVEFARIRVGFIEEIIKEYNSLLGEGVIEKVYAENYKLNPDFLPDEFMLAEFLNAILPEIAKLTNKRLETLDKKYSAKRGKRK